MVDHFGRHILLLKYFENHDETLDHRSLENIDFNIDGPKLLNEKIRINLL